MKLDKITSIRLYQGHNEQLQKLADIRKLDRADIHRIAIQHYLDYLKNNPF
jgi:hypothetical protein